MTQTILLADDSLTIQKVVELTFADTPYTVVAVSSGDELLAKISEVNPAVIICDILMPGRDGYDVCQDIKSSPDTLHIPVILLSGTFEPLDRDRALAVGCSEILAKPFEARKLIDTVERLVRSQEAPPVAVELRPRDAETGPIAFGAAGGGSFAPRPSRPADLRPAAPASEAAFNAAQLGDGLDFTKAGFDEFEAKAQERAAVAVEPPREGLDFDLGSGDVDPFSDLGDEPAEAPGDGTFADAFETGSDPFADPVQELDESDVAGAVFGSAERPEHRPAEVRVAVGPGDRPPAAEPVALGGELAAAPPTGPAPVAAVAPAAGGLDPAAAATVGAGSPFVTDADTAPLPPITGPVTPPADAAAAPAPAAAGTLSDDVVDRIARRLLELAQPMIEQIAWEVIPDVAEIMVRERIRQLEAEFETEN